MGIHAAVASRTGCGILCDVNNIYVSSQNHGWEPSTYLAGLPSAIIGEIHLAGHAVRQLADGRTLRIDDHGSSVIPEVWTLYQEALARFGQVPTLVEWDNNIPPLETLLVEFLQRFPPAAPVPYVGDEARLEWAVNRALQVPDVEPLELKHLVEVASDNQEDVGFSRIRLLA